MPGEGQNNVRRLTTAYNTAADCCCIIARVIIIAVILSHYLAPPQHTCRRTYVLPRIVSSFLFIFFFRHLICELAERNSTKIGHMLESNCDLKTHVQNLGYPFSQQIGGPKPPFWTTSNLTATLTAYILVMKHDIDNRSSMLTRVSYIFPKCHELWSTNILKLDRYFYPPSVNSAFYVIARLRKRRSENGTQPHFAKRWIVNRADNLL